ILSLLRPPHTTLVPYTTLFRSDHEGGHAEGLMIVDRALVGLAERLEGPPVGDLGHDLVGVDPVVGQHPAYLRLVAEVLALVVPRSEEHTSELQSLAYLVCRLLL